MYVYIMYYRGVDTWSYRELYQITGVEWRSRIDEAFYRLGRYGTPLINTGDVTRGHGVLSLDVPYPCLCYLRQMMIYILYRISHKAFFRNIYLLKRTSPVILCTDLIRSQKEVLCTLSSTTRTEYNTDLVQITISY